MRARRLSKGVILVFLLWAYPSLAGPLYELIPPPPNDPASCPELLYAFQYVIKDLRESSDPDAMDELRELLREPEIASDPTERALLTTMIRNAMDDQRMMDEVETQFPALWKDVESYARLSARAFLGDPEPSVDAILDWEPPGDFSIKTDLMRGMESLLSEIPPLRSLLGGGFMDGVGERSGASVLQELADVRTQQLMDAALDSVYDSEARRVRRNLLVGRNSRASMTAHVVFHQTKSLQAATADLLAARGEKELSPVLVIPDYAYHTRLSEVALSSEADLVRSSIFAPGLHPAVRIDADRFVLYGGGFDPWWLSSELRDLVKPSLQARRTVEVELRLEAMYGLLGKMVHSDDASEFNYEEAEFDADDVYEEWDRSAQSEEQYLARMEALDAARWKRAEMERYENVRPIGPWIEGRLPGERRRLLVKLATYLIDPHQEAADFDVIVEASAPSDRFLRIRVNYTFLFSDEEKSIRYLFTW